MNRIANYLLIEKTAKILYRGIDKKELAMIEKNKGIKPNRTHGEIQKRLGFGSDALKGSKKINNKKVTLFTSFPAVANRYSKIYKKIFNKPIVLRIDTNKIKNKTHVVVVEKKKYDEIAVIGNIPLSKVKIFKGRKAIKKIL